MYASGYVYVDVNKILKLIRLWDIYQSWTKLCRVVKKHPSLCII